MNNLKHSTLIECRDCDDRELSHMAAKALGVLEKEPCEEREPHKLSTGAIMDLYWSGDVWLEKKAKEQVMVMFGGYIHRLIHEYFPTYSSHFHEDLFQQGVMGALVALKTYDATYAFTTFSKVYILHEMSDFIGQMNGNPTSYYTKIQRQVKEAARSLEMEGLPIDSAEISRITGINHKVVERELKVLDRSNMLYLSSLNEDFDILPNGTGDMTEGIILNMDLSQALETLDEEELRLIRMVFINKFSISKASRKLSISYYDTMKRYMSAKVKLRLKLSDYGG